MAYSKIIFTQNNDYVAVRAEARFEINFTNNSVFGGAKIKVYKAFTKINGDIGFEDETNKLKGDEIQATYTKPSDLTFQAASRSTWYIFRVSDATPTTNIEVTINHDFPNTSTEEVVKRNIKTNILLIQQV